MVKSWVISCGIGWGLVLALASAGSAGDAGVILKKTEKLTEEDDKDKIMRASHAKVHTLKLDKGKAYRIDLNSSQFDSYLRLENADGKQLARDDDSGGFPHARIVFQSKEDGEYRIIATTFKGGQTGEYTLTVAPATPSDMLELRARTISQATPAERNATIADLKKHFQEQGAKLSARDAGLALNVAYSLEGRASKQAIETYNDFAKLLAGSNDPKVARTARMLEGSARRLGLPGQTMQVKGITLGEAKSLDLADLKGKVVLVDFWATWCGPCIAELPNMKKMREAYHDRGFEILAVSVDQNKDVAVKFMEARKLPWPCIHDSRDDGKSLSEHYGVMAIPLAILVDREGKVVSMNARGAELDRLLAKHIGPLEKEEKK